MKNFINCIYVRQWLFRWIFFLTNKGMNNCKNYKLLQWIQHVILLYFRLKPSDLSWYWLFGFVPYRLFIIQMMAIKAVRLYQNQLCGWMTILTLHIFCTSLLLCFVFFFKQILKKSDSLVNEGFHIGFEPSI